MTKGSNKSLDGFFISEAERHLDFDKTPPLPIQRKLQKFILPYNKEQLGSKHMTFDGETTEQLMYKDQRKEHRFWNRLSKLILREDNEILSKYFHQASSKIKSQVKRTSITKRRKARDFRAAGRIKDSGQGFFKRGNSRDTLIRFADEQEQDSLAHSPEEKALYTILRKNTKKIRDSGASAEKVEKLSLFNPRKSMHKKSLLNLKIKHKEVNLKKRHLRNNTKSPAKVQHKFAKLTAKRFQNPDLKRDNQAVQDMMLNLLRIQKNRSRSVELYNKGKTPRSPSSTNKITPRNPSTHLPPPKIPQISSRKHSQPHMKTSKPEVGGTSQNASPHYSPRKERRSRRLNEISKAYRVSKEVVLMSKMGKRNSVQYMGTV